MTPNKLTEKLTTRRRTGRPSHRDAGPGLSDPEVAALVRFNLGVSSSSDGDFAGALGLSASTVYRAKKGQAAALSGRRLIDDALLARAVLEPGTPYALPWSIGPTRHPLDHALNWMADEPDVRRVAAGLTEPLETTEVPTYARVDRLVVLVSPALGRHIQFTEKIVALGGRVHRPRGPDRPLYRSAASLPCGLHVSFDPIGSIAYARIDFSGRGLETGRAADVYRRELAPLLQPTAACSRIDIALDFAVPPLRVLPIGLAARSSRLFRPDHPKEGYAWPALRLGRVPNVGIGGVGSPLHWTIYDKWARIADKFWQDERYSAPDLFAPLQITEQDWSAAGLDDLVFGLRHTPPAGFVLTEAARRHDQVTRVEAKVRPEERRSPIGLVENLSNPFASLGMIDLLQVKESHELWWPALLRARLIGLARVERRLEMLGLSRAAIRERLAEFASGPEHGGLAKPAAVFEAARRGLQRQVDDVLGVRSLGV